MKNTLTLLSDQSERVPYTHPHMPVYVKSGGIAHFLNHTVPVHWHDEVELCAILSGHMSYNVNGTTHLLNAGDGIFVNSRQFHNNFSADKSACDYICLLFHPVLLCANPFIEQTFITPVITNSAFRHVILSRHTPWMATLLDFVLRAHAFNESNEGDLCLSLQSLFYQIWSVLYRHMPQPTEQTDRTTGKLSQLRDMTGFLQQHYHQHITLQQIAKSANICESACCAIFNQYLHQTPIQYLIDYRLNKSADLLKTTALPVTEIALLTGFFGASYYAETFKKHFSISPTAYRKRESAAAVK